MRKTPKVTKKCEHTWTVGIENDLQPNSMVPEGVQITPFVVATCSKCKMEMDANEINTILNTYAKGY